MNFEFLILNFEFRTIVRASINGSLIQNSKFKIQNFSLTERHLNVPRAVHEGSG
jgi:hypothetical protein